MSQYRLLVQCVLLPLVIPLLNMKVLHVLFVNWLYENGPTEARLSSDGAGQVRVFYSNTRVLKEMVA